MSSGESRWAGELITDTDDQGAATRAIRHARRFDRQPLRSALIVSADRLASSVAINGAGLLLEIERVGLEITWPTTQQNGVNCSIGFLASAHESSRHGR